MKEMVRRCVVLILTWVTLCVVLHTACNDHRKDHSSRGGAAITTATPAPVPIPTPRPITYVNDVRPEFLICASCHFKGGLGRGLILSGPQLLDVTHDYLAILPYTNQKYPVLSQVMLRAQDPFHGAPVPPSNGAVTSPFWPVRSPSWKLVLDWIAQGCPLQ